MDAKKEIILAIKNFQKQVKDKLLSGKASEKIVVFNKRVENAINKLSSEIEDFQEGGQMTLLREKLENSVKQVEGMIKVSKHKSSSESEAKNILNSNDLNYLDLEPEESKKLASIILTREIIKDLLTFPKEKWINDLENQFNPLKNKLSTLDSSLNTKAKKELENLFFANTIRDFSFDPESVLVKNKTEEIFQKVKRFNEKKASNISENILKNQISEIWQSLSYIKALGKEFKSKFFDNKSEILSFNEETGMDSGAFNAVFFDSRAHLSKGELDEDIEEISILPVIYWKENNEYIVPFRASTVRNNIKKFKKDGQNKPETEKNNNKKPLSEIEGWNSLSPHDKNKFSADYESGKKDFEKIKLEIERQRKGEKFKEEKTNNENSKNKPSTPKQKNKEKTTADRQQKLSQKKDQVITKITTALNQEPQLANSELSPEHQNWESQINQITDIQQIANFQDRILADISARRHDKKTAQKVKENLNKARTGTKQEKEQAWKDLEEQETEKSYQENQAEAENLKKEKAAENPQEYSEEAKQKIEKKLKNNGVKEGELSQENQAEWQKLRNGEIKNPAQLVEIETKITQNIYQKGVEKKAVDLTFRVNQVLKSKSDKKSQIDSLKKELLEFISSSNIYYSAHQKEVENLLAQLENYSINNQQNNSNSATKPDNFPWKVVVPLLLIGTLLLIALIVWVKIVRGRKKKNILISNDRKNGSNKFS